MSGTDYQQLYHLMSRRRKEELRQMEAFRNAYTSLLNTFMETDRLLSAYTDQRSGPVTRLIPGGERQQLELDEQIAAFLYRLDYRPHLKRAATAKAALRILLLEEDQIKSMHILYQKTAAVIGGTISGLERNLRSYRKAVAEENTDYYRVNLAQCSRSNAEFYWNALRLIKQEMR